MKIGRGDLLLTLMHEGVLTFSLPELAAVEQLGGVDLMCGFVAHSNLYLLK